MTDRELLEAAAKAAGWRMFSWRGAFDTALVIDEYGMEHDWNPLTDDGDALRLAVRLRINVYNPPGRGASASALIPETGIVRYCNEKESDRSATRRAIVRAAAEIGEQP